MTSALIRKARHVLGDPVLRRWLLRRMVGLEKAPPAFTPGAPPYLRAAVPEAGHPAPPVWTKPESGKSFEPPDGNITIDLPGVSVNVSANEPGSLFDRDYRDLETTLGAHRFAWVPLAGPDIDPNWVAALWGYWVEKYGTNRSGWPWHAYTAAERAVNIIDFSERFRLPGNREETLHILAGHAEAIRNKLEYFGEHYTSNHLSNNARGLLRIGVALGLENYANDGAQILAAEAGRIFGRSGLLNEGSSHYHLLVTRNYIDAWLAANHGNLEQAPLLGDIAERAVAAISGLCLPGGMPLIGDISPDAPPAYFAAMTGGDTDGPAWPCNMNEEYRETVAGLLSRIAPISPDRLAEDGWHRFGNERWQALAYVSPDGWPPMPGHGHQDLGSFELHDGDAKVIVDPGRGTYADAEYAAAAFHNGLTVSGSEPAPVNRPYYDDAFRRRVVRVTPALERTRTGRILHVYGFSRLSGVGKFERQWRFEDSKLEIRDRVEGRGTKRIDRRYVTSADVEVEDGCAKLNIAGRRWRLCADCQPNIKPATKWTAYGLGQPSHVITFSGMEKLPFEGTTVLERL
ncbi:MAG: hypothetical protein EVA87_05155 [Rhodospirillaceae bacterium]|nr:MAG: hypothetical protein EVA87_05155 [Rhodospirillaceae bacterium]